jgi:hypothetical protein
VKFASKLLSLLLFPSFLMAQSSFWKPTDSLNKARIITSSSIIGVGYAGSLIGLQQVWYNNPWTDFHFFNDGGNWLQMDKAGHTFTTYQISKNISQLYRWGGMKSKNADWVGVGVGLSYLTFLEVLDGFSDEWGFSAYDMLANVSGSALFWGQERLFKQQIIVPKFSFHTTEYAALRPEVLGSTFAEQLLKDYNGQTYWLSFSPGTMGDNKFPKWLCFSLGYSADQKIVGGEETYLNYQSRREFLLSMDIDFSRIPVKNHFLKTVFSQLNYLKIPFPTLMLQGNKFGARGLYF